MGRLLFIERWKPLNLSYESPYIKKLFNGKYEVSNTGKVRDSKTHKLLNTYSKDGYSIVVTSIVINGKKKLVTMPLHGLVADAFLYNPDRDLYNTINHKDENPENNDVRNLEWCTTKYNNHYSKHKIIKLSKDNIYKLYKEISQFQYLDMKFLYKTGKLRPSREAILLFANKYNVGESTIKNIYNRHGYYGWVIYTEEIKEFKNKMWENPDDLTDILEIFNKGFSDAVHYLDGNVPYKEI